MNRFEKLALVAAILATVAYLPHPGDIAYDYYRTQMPDGKLPIAIAGWCIATYGPIGLALLFWRGAKRFAQPWILHVAALPCAAAVLAIGDGMMLSTITDPDFDATLGAPEIGGFLLLLVAICGYGAGLVAKVFREPPGPDRAAKQSAPDVKPAAED